MEEHRQTEQPPTQPRAGVLPRVRKFIEFCGEHPFATGLFAILGIVGLTLSFVAFGVDRFESVDSARQVDAVSKDIQSEVSASSEAISRRVDDVGGDLRAEIKALEDKIGDRQGGRVFLLEDRIEGVYSNFWYAHPISKTSQAELTVIGEGKLADFVGLLTMNCENGKYFWKSSSNWSDNISETEADATVPEQVIRNIYRLFCMS